MTLYKRKPETVEALKISGELDYHHPFFDDIKIDPLNAVHQAKHFGEGYIVKWSDGSIALWDTDKFEAEYDPVS